MVAMTGKQRLIEHHENGVLLTNANAEEELTIYLPPPHNGRRYEILQLSLFAITLHTNSNDVSFLTSSHPRKLVISGEPSSIGKCLTVESYLGRWRITSSTFNESQLLFEE